MSVFDKIKFLNKSTGKEETLDVGAKGENIENGGNITNKFSQAGTRANLVSGEKQSVSFGKIMKWFADLKAAAFNGIVNNLLTTAAGYALDARQGKVLQDEITEINSKIFVKECGKRDFSFNTDTHDVPISFSGKYNTVPIVLITINGTENMGQSAVSLRNLTVSGCLVEIHDFYSKSNDYTRKGSINYIVL